MSNVLRSAAKPTQRPTKTRAAGLSIASNTTLILLKIVAGAVTGSIAILTEAVHSGIEAAALGGAPGVRSARFAGEHTTDEENLAKLLREVPPDGDLRVEYVCVLAYVEPDGDELCFYGRCAGTLTHEPRGSGGFGYDPAVIPVDTGAADPRTMAELSAEEKDAISHRGRAARAFLDWLARERRAA